MNRKFFISIPSLLKAKKEDQWTRVFGLCYDDEIENNPECFDRLKGRDRFHLLDCMKVPFRMLPKKWYIKKVLLMSNDLHKIEELKPSKQLALTDRALKLNSKTRSIDTTEVLVSSTGW